MMSKFLEKASAMREKSFEKVAVLLKNPLKKFQVCTRIIKKMRLKEVSVKPCENTGI